MRRLHLTGLGIAAIAAFGWFIAGAHAQEGNRPVKEAAEQKKEAINERNNEQIPTTEAKQKRDSSPSQTDKRGSGRAGSTSPEQRSALKPFRQLQQPEAGSPPSAAQANRADRQGQRPMSSLQNRQGQQPNVGKLGIRWKDHPDRLAIGNLTPNSASAQIGLRPGDEIVSIGGQNVVNEQQFNTAMQREMSRLGNNRTARIPFVIRRNGELQTLYWISDALAIAGYGLFARGYRAGSYAPDGQYIAGYRGYVNRSSAFLGVDLDQRNQNAAAVSRVIPGSPAEQAGLSEGDEIWSVNDRRINSPQELSFVIGQLQPGQTVSLLVGRPTNVQVVLGQRPGSADIRPAVPSQAPIPPQLQGLAPPARQRGGPVPAPAQPAPSDAAPELQNSDTP